MKRVQTVPPFRGIMTMLIVLAVVVTGAANSAGMHGTAWAATVMPGLQVSGNKLVDGTGQPVTLRGVDRSGTEYACVSGPGWADGPTDAASVQAMRSWGTNAVRVPLNEDCWLGINGVAVGGAAYQQAIEGWVQTLTTNGMYAILDLHWNAPGTDEATGQEPMADADHAPAFWTSVGTAFMANDNVLFDLYNEPDPIPYSPSYPGGFFAWQAADFQCVRDGCAVAATQGHAYQTAGMQSLVNAVRATGAANVVLVGGIQDAQTITQYLGSADTTNSYLPADSLNQLAVSTHMYAHDACGDSSCWTGTILPVAAKYPVVAGEFGDTDCTATLTTTLLPWLETNHINYLGWNWGTDFGCQSLVTSYTGTATSPYGQAYQSFLASLPSSSLAVPVSPTATTTPTLVPASSTPTSVPPTSTASATSTPIPPSATPTSVPPTATASATATHVPPTLTATATATRTATPSPTATPKSHHH